MSALYYDSKHIDLRELTTAVSFKRIIAVLLMLWLPFQTASAVVMPFCKHALRGQAYFQTMAGESHDACAGHCAPQSDGKDGAQPDRPDSVQCDQCDLCHLACAGFMPASFESVHSPVPGSAADGTAVRFRSVIPDLDDRPPVPVSL